MFTIIAGLEITFAIVVAAVSFYVGRVYERWSYRFHHTKERP